MLAGVLGTAPATSDAAGVDAFAARAERAGGVWPTLLGTGGVWSPFQVPGSLTSWPGHLLTRAGPRRAGRRRRSGWPGASRRWPWPLRSASCCAGIAHLPGGADALGWAVAHVPGAGLLRDGQKWLLPYVVVVVAAAGCAAARAEAALRRRDADLGRLVAGALVAGPGGADARRGRPYLGGRPSRSTYPAELAEAVAVLDDVTRHRRRGHAAVGVVPRVLLGQPGLGRRPAAALDPAPVVVSDALAVDGGRVAGEDPRAQAVAAVVAEPDGPLGRGRSRSSGSAGSWSTATSPGPTDLDTAGLTPVVEGPDVALYRVPGVDDGPAARPGRRPSVRRGRRTSCGPSPGSWGSWARCRHGLRRRTAPRR